MSIEFQHPEVLHQTHNLAYQIVFLWCPRAILHNLLKTRTAVTVLSSFVQLNISITKYFMP